MRPQELNEGRSGRWTVGFGTLDPVFSSLIQGKTYTMFGDSNPRDANAVQNQAQRSGLYQLDGTGASLLRVCCYQGTVSDIKWAGTWTYASMWSSLDLELSYMIVGYCRFLWFNTINPNVEWWNSTNNIHGLINPPEISMMDSVPKKHGGTPKSSFFLWIFHHKPSSYGGTTILRIPIPHFAL